MTEELALRLADVASSSAAASVRAEALLAELGRAIPFDSAWLALADPLGPGYSSLASTALDARTLDYLSGPSMAHDIEVTGADRVGPPLSPSDLPFPAADLPTWAECLIPAGYHEALAVALFGAGHRHIGFLALLSATSTPPADEVRRRLDGITPLLAEGIDPMRSVLVIARLVEHAFAGVTLDGGHHLVPLPGFSEDTLLAAGSPVIEAARHAITTEEPHVSFLWPRENRLSHDRHVRVTAIAGSDRLGTELPGVVLLSPAGPLRGLTGRELQVLGLIIAGHSNREIADDIVIAPRTVAAHVEHILTKLDAPSRTLAAVRAQRMGLYVPPTTRGR